MILPRTSVRPQTSPHTAGIIDMYHHTQLGGFFAWAGLALQILPSLPPELLSFIGMRHHTPLENQFSTPSSRYAQMS
jgi:hypothetical protein